MNYAGVGNGVGANVALGVGIGVGGTGVGWDERNDCKMKPLKCNLIYCWRWFGTVWETKRSLIVIVVLRVDNNIYVGFGVGFWFF